MGKEDHNRPLGESVHITGKNREGLKRAVEYLQEVELRLERVDNDLEALRRIASEASAAVLVIEARIAVVEGEVRFGVDEIQLPEAP